MMVSAWLLALAAAGATPPTEAPRVYSVIVATNNAVDDDQLRPLRFADDDGARYFELLSLVSDRVELLSVLDPDTQRVHPGVAQRARPPTRRELSRTLRSVYAQISQAEASGQPTVFYFVYVGHGSVTESGEGAMHLLDGQFTRVDLYREVLARSPARVNHVVVDACNAYLMVAQRGETLTEQEIDGAVRRFLAEEDLERYPNTGVVVSTSQAAETHEWARFESGVFSHEVRSALIGAADVDGDGAVRYDEVDAFIRAANARVAHPKAKIRAYVRPPNIHLKEPLFDRKLAPRAPTLRIPSPLAGRYFLEDHRGVRFADFHLAAWFGVTLVLVPATQYFLRSDTSEVRIPFAAVNRANAADYPAGPPPISARGATDRSFRSGLFAVPFGPGYFEGFIDAKTVGLARRPEAMVTATGWTPADKWALSLGAATVVAATAGIVLRVMADSAADDFRTSIGNDNDIADLRRDAATKADASTALFITAGGLLAGTMVSLLVDSL